MPKKRKQSVYRTYTDENFIKAIDGIKSGRVSQRKAASLYSIPQATLSDHMRGRVKDNTPVGRKPVIPIEIEKQIVKKCAQAAEMGLGMNKAQVMEKVGHLAKELNLDQNFKNNTPGKDWWYGFKGRNPTVTLRSPEKLTSIRARALNSVKVGEYFLDLKKEMNRLGLNDKPELVWNMDEKGVPLEHTPSKVVAAKSSRTIPGRVSNTRERNTIFGCINARGDRMPPLIIVKGKTQKAVMSYNTADGPVGATWTYQAKAWTEDVLGIEWFTNIFLKKCGNQRPQLLILDGHHSHEVLGLIEKARENNITLLTLPPHTTHYLCPLDRTVFGPLSKNYDRICSEYCQNPGNLVNKITWPGLFRRAFETAFKPENIISGFRSCGIFPWNPLNIPSAAFAPASAFDTNKPDTNEHPLQWVIRKSFETESRVEEVTVVRTKPSAGPEARCITTEITDTVPLNEIQVQSYEQNVIDVPGSPEDPHFMHTLSADVLLPIVDSETREAVESLISLDSSFSETIYEVDSVFQPLSETLSTPCSSTTVDWNASVNAIFSVDPPPQKKARINKTSVTGHRILTSDEVIESKRKIEDMKLKKEQAKEKRLKIREMINAKKQIEKEIKAVRSEIDINV